MPCDAGLGGRDPLIPTSAARALLDALPGVHNEVLPGIGHLPQLENPARLVELLGEFTPRNR